MSDDGYSRWRRKLYEENPNLTYLSLGIDHEGNVRDIESMGIPPEALEQLSLVFEKAKAIRDLDLYHEMVKFGFHQLVFRAFSKEQLTIQRILGANKDEMDLPFELAAELAKTVKAKFFPMCQRIL